MKKFRLMFAVLAVTVLVTAPFFLKAEGRVPEGESKPLRGIIHINFADTTQQGHGLKNIKNILKATQGKAIIEVVCHGAGIGLLVQELTKHAEDVAGLIKDGVHFMACENTLREKKIAKEKLLPNVGTVPSGAVEVIQKQQEGYGYFKP